MPPLCRLCIAPQHARSQVRGYSAQKKVLKSNPHNPIEKRLPGAQVAALREAREKEAKKLVASPVPIGQVFGKASPDKKQFTKTLHLPKTKFEIQGDTVRRQLLYRKRSTEALYRWQVG